MCEFNFLLARGKLPEGAYVVLERHLHCFLGQSQGELSLDSKPCKSCTAERSKRS